VRPVVTIEPFDQDRQQLLDTIAKLDRRAPLLAAVVRILLALLRASGFSLAGGQRLPEGNAKAGILRAITSANPFLPLAMILRIAHLEPGRYHVWNRASRVVCGLDDRSSCPHTSPSQLMPAEVGNIKDMVLAPEYRHMAAKKCKRKGFGWKRWSSTVVYGTWGLFRDYRVVYWGPKASSS
jgi:hypothetical protein